MKNFAPDFCSNSEMNPCYTFWELHFNFYVFCSEKLNKTDLGISSSVISKKPGVK